MNTTLKARLVDALKQIARVPISPSVFVPAVALLRFAGFLRSCPTAPVETRKIQRIMVCSLFDSVGDGILLLPLLEAIRANWPDAQLDVAIGERMAALLSEIPYINKVIRYPTSRSRLRLPGAYLSFLRVFSLYRREVMSTHYDLAIVSRWTPDQYHLRSVYLAYLSSATIRCGYSSLVEEGGDPGIDRMLTQVVRGGHDEHESLRNTRLLKRAGLVTLDATVRWSDSSPIESLIAVAEANSNASVLAAPWAQRGLFRTSYAVLAPGATTASRLWPTSRFREVVSKLWTTYRLPCIIAGSDSDAGLCQMVADGFEDHAQSVAGKTTIIEMLAILQGASLFVGGDSGPAHMAGSLGIPTVVVSPFPLSGRSDHPNSLARFHPCGPNVRLVQPADLLPGCSPVCTQSKAHCITQIGVGEVMDKIGGLIQP